MLVMMRDGSTDLEKTLVFEDETVIDDDNELETWLKELLLEVCNEERSVDVLEAICDVVFKLELETLKFDTVVELIDISMIDLEDRLLLIIEEVLISGIAVNMEGVKGVLDTLN